MTLKECGLERDGLDALATAAEKSREPGLVKLAESLRLPLMAVTEAEMQAVADKALSVSSRVMALKGVPSVAETAALAAAGKDARLLAPRLSTKGATCAIASGGSA
ncbi:cobalamin biosynthesis protein [Methyloligella sp. GL2]|uniref:cobalamin biosynthesis protein n=2 Tax=unclassified Methyloligella TaxID=2625955 RepID=UPI001FEE00C0|nr:cobalamin biosynthesis protein [Methyloligella sp. GL2]